MTINLLKTQVLFSQNSKNIQGLYASPSSRKVPEYATYRKFTSGFFESEFVRKHPRHAAIYMLFTINATKEGLLRLSSGEFMQRYPNLAGSKRSFFRQLDWLETENYINITKSSVGTSVIVKDFKEHQSKKRYVRIYCDDFRKLIRKHNLLTAAGATTFFTSLKEFYKKEISDDVERKQSFEVKKTMVKDSLYLPEKDKPPHKTPHPYIYSKGYCNIGFDKRSFINFNKNNFLETMAKIDEMREKYEVYQNKIKQFINNDSEFIKSALISQPDEELKLKIIPKYETYLNSLPNRETSIILKTHSKIHSVRKKQIFIEIYNLSEKITLSYLHSILKDYEYKLKCRLAMTDFQIRYVWFNNDNATADLQ